MIGKDPQRSCLGCRRTTDKKELLRFVLAPDRTLVPDILAKLPGRGAYTCMNRACLANAARNRQFARAFKGEVRHDGAEQLTEQVAGLLRERIGSYLALANKAGRAVSGSDMVMDLIRKRKAGVIFLADDISPEIGARISELACRYDIPCVTVFDKERLGSFVGKGMRSAAAIEESGFVGTVVREIARYRNFFEGGMDAR